MKTTLSSRLQANFLTGLAVVLPSVVSIAVLVWLFGTVANITDKLLFAVPPEWKYVDGVGGAIRWYWSLAALLLAVALVTLIGRLTRHYLGKRMIQAVEELLLNVPLLNKIYSTVKQVKEAFSGNKSSFEEAVLVEFPRTGVYSLGFVTGSERDDLLEPGSPALLSVFIPTTPNPTTGFLIFVPRSAVRPLTMPVADAIKTIISLGAVNADSGGKDGKKPADAVPTAP